MLVFFLTLRSLLVILCDLGAVFVELIVYGVKGHCLKKNPKQSCFARCDCFSGTL